MSKEVFGINVKDLVLIGKGVEGNVFLTSDKKVLKVYKSAINCSSEYRILKTLNEDPHFPKVIECKGIYMLREYVDGTPLSDYIRYKGLSEKLAINLIKLAEDFYNLRNIKVDGINKHVLVQKDESVKVIDPRKKTYAFYRSLFRTLEIVGVFDDFVKILKRERPDLASKWLDEKDLNPQKIILESNDSVNEVSDIEKPVIEPEDTIDEVADIEELVIEPEDSVDEVSDIEELVIEPEDSVDEVSDIEELVIEPEDTIDEVSDIEELVIEPEDTIDEVSDIEELVIEPEDSVDEVSDIEEPVIEPEDTIDEVADIEEPVIEPEDTIDEVADIEEPVIEPEDTVDEVADIEEPVIEPEDTIDEVSDIEELVIEPEDSVDEVADIEEPVIEPEDTIDEVSDIEEPVIEPEDSADEVSEYEKTNLISDRASDVYIEKNNLNISRYQLNGSVIKEVKGNAVSRKLNQRRSKKKKLYLSYEKQNDESIKNIINLDKI